MARLQIHKFEGTVLDAHPARLADGMFQADEGGDRFQRGSWQTRRGMLHTTVPKQVSPVQTLIGFNVPGQGEALTVLVGTQTGSAAASSGFQNVTTQGTGSSVGFGAQGFGVGGFGG